MVNYFLIEEQMHFCLALAIIQQENLDNNQFIVSRPDLKNNSEILSKALIQNDKVKVSIHLVFEEMPEPKKYENRIWKARKNFKKKSKEIKKVLKSTSKAKDNKSLYLFDDTTVTAKFLVRQKKRKFESFYFFKVNSVKSLDSILRATTKTLLTNKIKFGLWWQFVAYGDLVDYKKVYILDTTKVEDSKKKQIDQQYLFNPLWQNFSVNVLNQYFSDVFTTTNKSSIVFLPLILSEKSLKEVSVEVLQKFGNSENRVYLKNNPQSPFVLRPKESRKNWILIHENVPNECLMAMQSEIGAKMFVPNNSMEQQLLISETKSHMQQILFSNIAY